MTQPEKVERVIRGRFRISENLVMAVRDRNGKIKPIFTENKLGQKILKFFRKIVKTPIDSTGKVKSGLLNYLAAFGVRIPYLTGMWGDYRLVSNLITNAGMAGVASRINGDGSEAAFSYLALGIGTTAANVADTTLESEIVDSGLARAAATASRVQTDVANDTAQLAKTWTASGSKNVTEVGALNASSTGVLLNRQVFSAIPLASGDQFTITAKFDVD